MSKFKSSSELRVIIAEKLRHRRYELGISQSKASDLSGLHKSSIHEYENNLTPVSAINLYKLSKTYKVSMEYFFRALDVFHKDEINMSNKELEESQMIIDYQKEEIYYG